MDKRAVLKENVSLNFYEDGVSFLKNCANLIILETKEKQTKSMLVLWSINGITYNTA
jgi:hypothetical protein